MIAILTWAQALWAQSDQVAQPPPEGWDVKTKTMLNLGQISYNSKWAAGVTNVLSATGNINLTINYLKDVEGTARVAFVNTIGLNYGVQKPEGFSIQKSSDNLQINSMAAYRIAKDLLFNGDALYLGGISSLYTQISPGYLVTFTDADGKTAYYGVAPHVINPVTGGEINPRKGLKVSNFMAPGYLWVRGGFRYLFTVQGKGAVFFQFAPISLKQTYVADDEIRLSEAQAADPQFAANFDIYGTGGKTVKTSTGSTVDLDIKAPLGLVTPALQNISLAANIVGFISYSDPVLDFLGSIALQGHINKYLAASVLTTFIYDDRVDTDLAEPGKQTGVQLTGTFGVGLTLQF